MAQKHNRPLATRRQASRTPSHSGKSDLLEEFSNLGKKLSSATSAEQASRIILDLADKIWGWDCAYLHLYSEETKRLHPILTMDIIDGRKTEVSSAYVPESPSISTLGILRGHGKLILRRKGDAGPLGLGPFGDTTRLSRSILVVPIRDGKKVTAVLSIDSYTANAYTLKDLKTLKALADHCGGALQRIWAQEALRESETKLRALAARQQIIREEEGIRIAREIHDELGQALTGLKMDLFWIKKRLVATNENTVIADKLKSMADIADQTIRSVRRICAELRPGILDDLGLLPAIEWQTREFQSRSGIQCELTIPTDKISLDQPRSTALFRIYQEILTNIARHARATRATMLVKKSTHAIVIDVRDNGIGIDDKQISDKKSLGLTGIRERALVFGGTVMIKRGKDRGTVVRVSIPYPEDSERATIS